MFQFRSLSLLASRMCSILIEGRLFQASSEPWSLDWVRGILPLKLLLTFCSRSRPMPNLRPLTVHRAIQTPVEWLLEDAGERPEVSEYESDRPLLNCLMILAERFAIQNRSWMGSTQGVPAL